MKKLPLFALLFIAQNILWAQEDVTISGYLTDASNGEALIFGNVLLKNTLQAPGAPTEMQMRHQDKKQKTSPI